MSISSTNFLIGGNFEQFNPQFPSQVSPQTQSARNTLKAAHDLHERGLTIIPLKPKSKLSDVKWKEFQTNRPTIDQIENWFAEEPDRNIGILTGAASEIVVLDVDDYRGGSDSIAPFDRVITPTAKTGRGHHYYFKHPGIEVQNEVDILPGVDLRGDGGYVVAPPSVHENGKQAPMGNRAQ